MANPNEFAESMRGPAIAPKTMQTIKLYAAGVTTSDNVASFIVPQSGRIVALGWACYSAATAIGQGITWQVSQQSTGQFATNDARGIIGELVGANQFASATSGNIEAWHKTEPVAGISVKAGDRIYLHRQATVGTAASAVANVTVQIV